jgi:phosphomannomutase
MTQHKLNKSILREYDIRGIFNETLFEEDAYLIGRGYACLVGAGKTITIAYDGRLSSPILKNKLIQGVREGGVNVVEVGLGPTPMLYYSVFQLKGYGDIAGGIMVTGSHNPPNHNGFKIMLGKSTIHGDGIQKLGQIIASGDFINGSGSHEIHDIRKQYAEELAQVITGSRPIKAVWDPGSGAAGEVVAMLAELIPGEHILINAEIDGTFPAHHADPTVPENLEQLIELVAASGAEVGLAFDGDGDRVGVVDATGRIIWGDQLMAIFAKDVLQNNPGATIISEVKASQKLYEEIARLGGKPLMWKTGHSLIKAKMKETGSPLAGEMSGHIFFADKYYGFDDGIYAALRLINILANSSETLETIADRLPKTFSTPEIRIEIPEERKFSIMSEIAADVRASGADFSDVDGVRVNTADGWWLLRASNTQAVLVGRCESESVEGLNNLKAQVNAFLAKAGLAAI